MAFPTKARGYSRGIKIHERIYVDHQPVIVRHGHAGGGGHFVVIRDAYHIDGKDYVVIADNKRWYPETPTLGGNWAVEDSYYASFNANNSTWWSAGMVSHFGVK